MQHKPTVMQDRVVIQGGLLKKDALWAPRDVSEGNPRFLKLHGDEYHLAGYLGMHGANDKQHHAANSLGFLDHLRGMRTAAMQTLVLAHIRKEIDPMATKFQTSMWKQVKATELPQTVPVDIGHDDGPLMLRSCVCQKKSVE